MPMLPPKNCSYPRCTSKATKGARCDDHQPEPGWTKSNQGKTRHQRGYGHKWDKLRKRILMRDNYLCQMCLKSHKFKNADQVDHIKPKSQGGTDEPENLQSLCYACHKEKTNSERK